MAGRKTTKTQTKTMENQNQVTPVKEEKEESLTFLQQLQRSQKEVSQEELYHSAKSKKRQLAKHIAATREELDDLEMKKFKMRKPENLSSLDYYTLGLLDNDIESCRRGLEKLEAYMKSDFSDIKED